MLAESNRYERFSFIEAVVSITVRLLILLLYPSHSRPVSLMIGMEVSDAEVAYEGYRWLAEIREVALSDIS